MNLAARWQSCLKRWLEAGLIEPATIERIRAYEAAQAEAQERSYESSDLHVLFIRRQERELAVLSERVAFFIPEHVADPSIRPAGEELWAEVTIPKNGPPRPIRLGVKKGDGPIVPVELG